MTDDSIPYAMSDLVFPSPSDDDLWKSIRLCLLETYPRRALEEHMRQAFEAVCAECDDSMLFKDFLRKVRLQWLWKRPPAPRGVVDLV